MCSCATRAILSRTSCGARTARLRYARSLSFDEAMNFLSGVRLAVGLKLITGLSVYTLNKLLIFSQSAHLAHAEGRALTESEANLARARYVRQALASGGGAGCRATASGTDPRDSMNGYNFTERVRKVLADGARGGGSACTTSTSARSTSCSASSARARASPRPCCRTSTSTSTRSSRRSRRRSRRGRRPRPPAPTCRTRRAPRRCSSSR